MTPTTQPITVPTVTVTPTPQATSTTPEVKPEGDYSIYSPDDYDYINWQYALAAYTEAWYNRDWKEASKNALPSWRNRVQVTPESVVQTMLEFKHLKGIEVTGAKTVDDSTVIVTANAWYYDEFEEADVVQPFTATFKRETTFGNPGKSSGIPDRFYVDPFMDWGDPKKVTS